MAMKPKTLNEMIQCTIIMYILINFLMRTSQELGMYSLMRLKVAWRSIHQKRFKIFNKKTSLSYLFRSNIL